MQRKNNLQETSQTKKWRTTMWMCLWMSLQSCLLRLESLCTNIYTLKGTIFFHISVNFDFNEKNFFAHFHFDHQRRNIKKFSCGKKYSASKMNSCNIKVNVPKECCNPYAICDPLYPCDMKCVPVNICGSYCQPFPTPGSKHCPRCDYDCGRNKQYPEYCVPQCQ